MGFIKDLFSGGAGKLVDSIGKVLDNVVTTKEEKLLLENEMRKSEQQFQVEMKKLSIEERLLVFDDIGSARVREAKVQTSEHATKLAKNISPYLTLGTTFITLTFFIS